MKPFLAGERVLLIDGRGRQYLIRLQVGQTFHFHGGAVRHDDIIDASEGVEVRSASDARLVAFRPRLADFVLKMPRGAQVVYPKDLAAIVMEADIFPGARVLEAGTGSGALCIALCRAVGPSGRVVTYEMRDEFRERAGKNIDDFFGGRPEVLDLRAGDLRDVTTTGEMFDRTILDMPQPWDMLEALEAVLERGGIVCTYLPTTGQVQTLALALESAGYEQVRTTETLVRSWHVTGRSVRPDHRMVGHTGFLTTARRAGGSA